MLPFLTNSKAHLSAPSSPHRSHVHCYATTPSSPSHHHHHYPNGINSTTTCQGTNVPPQLSHVVRKHFGHPLPSSYEQLLHLFTHMERVVAVGHSRGMRLTFDFIARNVAKNTKRKFTQEHLSQIVHLYPHAYVLHWEKGGGAHAKPGSHQRQSSPTLTLKLNLKTDISEFTQCHSQQQGQENHSTIATVAAVKRETEEELGDRNAERKDNKKASGIAHSVLKARLPHSLPITPIKREPRTPVVSPSKSSSRVLISPTKPRRNGRDYIAKSPTKAFVGGATAGSSIHIASPARRILFADEPRGEGPKLEGWRLAHRKMIFRHLLVVQLKQHHEQFLREKKVEMPNSDANCIMIHPDFHLDSVPPLPEAPFLKDGLQRGHKSPLKTMRDYLLTIPKEEVGQLSVEKRVIGLLATPEKSRTFSSVNGVPLSPSKFVAHKQCSSGHTSEEGNGCKRKPLLERIREKEAAAREAKNSPAYQSLRRRHEVITLLRSSMVEVILSHYSLRKVTSMGLSTLQPLVTHSCCGKMDKETFHEHIDVLCEVCPQLCAKEEFAGEHCMRLLAKKPSRASDKLLRALDAELAKVTEELSNYQML